MEIYRVPKVETTVRILLDDGRTIEGAIFTATTGPTGGPETVLDRLLDATEEFLPLATGEDRLLLNKGGIIFAEAPLDAVGENLLDEGAKEVLVRITLAGGTSLLGRLAIRMPAGRERVLDYLNASPRFVPLLGDRRVSIVHKRFIVTVRSAVQGE